MGRWFLCLLQSVPWLAASGVVGLVSRRRGLAIFRSWGRAQARLFGIEVVVVDENAGRYDRPPYLFVLLNQSSLAEAFIWPHFMPLPFRVLMNLEFALLPFVGTALWLMRNPVVVRQWPWQARRAIERTKRILKSGESVAISIEGRRSPDGKLGPYKKGPAVLAISTGATIVPYSIRGARSLMPYGDWRIRPGKAQLTFHQAIGVEGLRYEDRDALVAKIRAIAEARCAIGVGQK